MLIFHFLKLVKYIKAMGVDMAFDPKKSDFTGIIDPSSREKELAISKIIHHALIEVDEDGTIAAAATAAIMVGSGMPRPETIIDFICDRPFFFFIHDKIKHNVLFFGKFSKPF
jgi:serine protease inhibitor